MKYNILSIFDGIGMAHQALKNSGIEINNYFSSEIDKNSIKISNSNHNQINLGNIKNINCDSLKDIKIDLLIGGSPCTNLSFAGKQKGLVTKDLHEITSLEQYLDYKERGFEFEGQSYLFWEYIRLLRDIKPKYFFLENVVMEEKWEKIFTENLGVNPIKINSNIFGCQNRPRLYWTNIPYDTKNLPHNLNIKFEKIKQKSINKQDYYSDKAIDWLVNHSYRKFLKTTKIKKLKLYMDDSVINAITASHCKKYSGQRFFAILDNGIDNSIQKNKIKEIYEECKKNNDFTKLQILTGWEHILYKDFSFRYITPEECELAQHLPLGYTNMVSNTQRFKSIGNGFDVAVISWFLNFLKE